MENIPVTVAGWYGEVKIEKLKNDYSAVVVEFIFGDNLDMSLEKVATTIAFAIDGCLND